MELEITPRPEDDEALRAAVQALLGSQLPPPGYRSAWRQQGIRENVDDADELED